MANNILVVELIDYPEIIQVEKMMVCKAPKEVLDYPVLVGKCSLEEKAAKHVDKLMTLQYQTVEVEVLGSQDRVTRVRILCIE